MEPNYSPKLKAVMAEILALLKKNDVGAVVVLHTPEIIGGVQGTTGASEYLTHLTPGYSAVELMSNGMGLTIKGHRKHYGDDTTLRNRKLRDTTNMLMHLGTVTGRCALMVMDLSQKADEVWKAEHGDWKEAPGNSPMN
jgi:hypothetical protein